MLHLPEHQPKRNQGILSSLSEMQECQNPWSALDIRYSSILSTVFFENQPDVRKSKAMHLRFWFCRWNGTTYNYNRFRCVSDRDKKVLLRNRHDMNCTGQTGYTMHILDEIIDKMVRQIFSRLRGIPKEQLITSRYAKETAERKNHLQALQAERDKAEKDLLALKTEILAVIKGESAFPKDTLAEMIAAQEKKHTELDTLCEEASAELERNAELMANVSQLYEELISYADLYDSASFEAKKMIVSQLIRRVEVYRGYQIHVDFNFDLAQYLENSDELAC